jgi:hypothetical protein
MLFLRMKGFRRNKVDKKTLLDVGFSDKYASIVENARDYESLDLLGKEISSIEIFSESNSELSVKGKNKDTNNIVII